jgi:hydrogenase maturation protein HypF
MSAQPESADIRAPQLIARRLRLSGHVQGVGFRPFVYRLAGELGVAGTVQNLLGEVEVVAQGTADTVDRFVRELIESAPPLARPLIRGNYLCDLLAHSGFQILDSTAMQGARICVPPDYFTCDACLAEMRNPTDRRYRYPFINCTQCGPRYTLMRELPYDRPNTTMDAFPLCAGCRLEYENPFDRRFHAEPIACPVCGPRLWLEENGERLETELALAKAVELLRRGCIIAVKGIGGYHLLCDATNQECVERLRARKGRPHKPLAVMFPQSGHAGLEMIRRDVLLSGAEAGLLTSPARSIVLVRRRSDSMLATAVAPGLSEVGVFLPYSPLHHLLLSDFGGPLVATSGNISGEPVLTEPSEASLSLSAVADAFLHHDRPIARPNDDSVARLMLGRPRTLRLGRGLAPLELDLPWRLSQPVLAVGGHLKTTVALAWDKRVVISPHIGDMGTVRGERVFEQVAEDLQRLYGVRAARVVCDAHPNYATTAWAARSGLAVNRVLHHHAHASALAGEYEPDIRMLVFAWDGAGFGADRTLWGGETFLGRPGEWQRVASLRPFRLPGGERAGRSPWRSAAALCWDLERELPGLDVAPLVRVAWQRNLNCQYTSSVGRLFDAAAALVLHLHDATYEGQGPMMLEAAAVEADEVAADCAPLLTYQDESGLTRLDWRPLINQLLDSRDSPVVGASLFHMTLASTIADLAEQQRALSGIDVVGLTGGVFQNVRLTTLAHDLLTRKGFRVCLAERVPCNDGGLSYGQIIEFARRQHLDPRK